MTDLPVDHDVFQRFFDEADIGFQQDLVEHFTSWGIEPQAYLMFLNQYSEVSAERMADMPLQLALACIMNAGFEWGYKARLEVESLSKESDEESLDAGLHALTEQAVLNDRARCAATEAMARCVYFDGHEGSHLWEDVVEFGAKEEDDRGE